MYRSLSLALASALMAPLSQALATEFNIDTQCEVESSYELTIERDRLVFVKDGGGEIAFANGRLLVDGKALALSRADASRVAEFERSVRALVPEVKSIARDAVEIAVVALTRMIDTFATEANRASFVAELDAMRVEIDTLIEQTNSTRGARNGEFEAKAREFAERIAPRIAGEFASQAVTAALSGDEARVKAIEAKAERLDKEIEASVEAPAKALEARANALCPRIKALDLIEDEFELRLPDGQPLNLVEVERKV